jgi:hypothetical protein
VDIRILWSFQVVGEEESGLGDAVVTERDDSPDFPHNPGKVTGE